jgi:hypothetical protein
MSAAKLWNVDIYISEHEDEGRTHAEARLHTRDKTDVRGTGEAKRNPHDLDVPEIGDELAAARALADLSRKLREAAASDIEGTTHESAHLDR